MNSHSDLLMVLHSQVKIPLTWKVWELLKALPQRSSLSTSLYFLHHSEE